MNVRRWVVVVVRLRIYLSILKFDVILTAIYGHPRTILTVTDEFIGPHYTVCFNYCMAGR